MSETSVGGIPELITIDLDQNQGQVLNENVHQ